MRYARILSISWLVAILVGVCAWSSGPPAILHVLGLSTAHFAMLCAAAAAALCQGVSSYTDGGSWDFFDSSGSNSDCGDGGGSE